MKEAEQKYTTGEQDPLQLLAVVHALQLYRHVAVLFGWVGVHSSD